MPRLLLMAMLSTMLIACAGKRQEAAAPQLGPQPRPRAPLPPSPRVKLVTTRTPYEAVKEIAAAFSEMRFRDDGDHRGGFSGGVDGYRGDILSGSVKARTSGDARIYVYAKATSADETELTISSDLPDRDFEIVLSRVREVVGGTPAPQE